MLRVMFALLALLWGALLDTEGDPPPDDPPADPPADPPEKEKKWTDRDVDGFKGTAREEGRTTERNAWCSALGVKDMAEAKQIVEAYREHQRQNQSEEERRAEEIRQANEAREQAERERDQEREQRQRILIEREVEAELLSEDVGVRPERLRSAMRHVDLSKVSVGDDGKVTGAKEAAQAAKDEAPEFFKDSGEPDDKRQQPRVNRVPQKRGGRGGNNDRPAYRPPRIRPGQQQ